MADGRKDNIIRNSPRYNGAAGREVRKPGNRIGVRLIVIYLLVFAGIAFFSWVVSGKEGDGSTELGYEENAVVVTDEDELQKMVDEMQNKDGKISLEYKNIATGGDGSKFSCYIANSAKNRYDMYIGIYTDDSYEEEIYLSQLLKPGSGIKNFESNKKLAPGTHNVILLFTLVGDDHETIMSQTPVTYTLNVAE